MFSLSLFTECYTANGEDYRGFQNQTSLHGGKPCLFWNETFQHPYNTLKYPNGEGGLGSHNYCRWIFYFPQSHNFNFSGHWDIKTAESDPMKKFLKSWLTLTQIWSLYSFYSKLVICYTCAQFHNIKASFVTQSRTVSVFSSTEHWANAMLIHTVDNKKKLKSTFLQD